MWSSKNSLTRLVGKQRKVKHTKKWPQHHLMCFGGTRRLLNLVNECFIDFFLFFFTWCSSFVSSHTRHTSCARIYIFFLMKISPDVYLNFPPLTHFIFSFIIFHINFILLSSFGAVSSQPFNYTLTWSIQMWMWTVVELAESWKGEQIFSYFNESWNWTRFSVLKPFWGYCVWGGCRNLKVFSGSKMNSSFIVQLLICVNCAVFPLNSLFWSLEWKKAPQRQFTFIRSFYLKSLHSSCVTPHWCRLIWWMRMMMNSKGFFVFCLSVPHSTLLFCEICIESSTDTFRTRWNFGCTTSYIGMMKI